MVKLHYLARNVGLEGIVWIGEVREYVCHGAEQLSQLPSLHSYPSITHHVSAFEFSRMTIHKELYTHFHRNRLVGLIALDNNVRILKVFNVHNIVPCPAYFWERTWFTFELELQRLHVVSIYVSIAKLDDKLACGGPGDMGYHMSQKCIGRNVERNAESQISRTLVHQT